MLCKPELYQNLGWLRPFSHLFGLYVVATEMYRDEGNDYSRSTTTSSTYMYIDLKAEERAMRW